MSPPNKNGPLFSVGGGGAPQQIWEVVVVKSNSAFPGSAAQATGFYHTIHRPPSKDAVGRATSHHQAPLTNQGALKNFAKLRKQKAPHTDGDSTVGGFAKYTLPDANMELTDLRISTT